MNQQATDLLKSVEKLPENQMVYNTAGQLRAAGLPVASELKDHRYVGNSVAELHAGLRAVEAAYVEHAANQDLIDLEQ